MLSYVAITVTSL